MRTPLPIKTRLLFFMIVAILTSLIVGCSVGTTENEENTLEGIVALINDDQILLVEGLTSEEVKGLTEVEVLHESDGAAAYLVLAEGVENLTIGDKVKVWIEVLDESAPAYGNASKVEILEKVH
ncbi:DUF3221 domain-containing protein [Alkalicoccobacillus plakortidis]|uniref:YobA family protein n=1 Tax=Alkalicoccobacillus plakortidis TaxID=444060 RepID=A0ABT0XKU4_9BACI|nr:DUF3221 domain-containing protein [Alkalicoccobacillus plakortidis]MCM2676350.1 YobA family protein [Alkalicoccobacillus plakortidis]